MYHAPLKDLRFVLEELLDIGQLAALPRYHEFSDDLAWSVLDEAAKFAEQELAPINRLGDTVGAKWNDGIVNMPPEFRVAYKRFAASGWTALTADSVHGGQNAPITLASAVEEIWFGANLGFMVGPQLGRGAIEALEAHASADLAARLVPEMVAGHWGGTMNLTEPQAGSDLAAIRTRATPSGDHYLISGQKIFISYGEHDLTDNIVHLVLARIDGAPAGVRGISLFAVPKFLPQPGGALGTRNDLRCASIEHKLGIHASPTCAMSYGDHGGAIGYLIGEPHRGLEYMFVMMNSARLSVGIQGLGLAELALQQACDWARNRVQGKPMGAGGEGVETIIGHPDVRRMLLTMKANIEAMRALAMYASRELDYGRAAADETLQRQRRARGEVLTPIVKGWCTELANSIASLAVQVHGGMGFVEETGVAQTLRDARITAIYEGTTGIQANDLLGRKLLRDRGVAMGELLAALQQELAGTPATGAASEAMRAAGVQSLELLRHTTTSLMTQAAQSQPQALAVAVPYLMLCGRVLGGVLLIRSALICATHLAESSGSQERDFYRAKLQTARFYIEQLLPEALMLQQIVQSGGASVVEAQAALI